jgi:segregation and condensation protein B
VTDVNENDEGAPEQKLPEEGLSDEGLSDEGLSDEGLSDEGLSDEGLAAVSEQAPAVEAAPLEASPPEVSADAAVAVVVSAEPGEEGAEPDEDQAPGATPFVLEDWVYAAVEAMAFSSLEPLTPRRAKEILVAELRLIAQETSAEGPPSLPTIQDVKRVFKTLRARWAEDTRPLGQGMKLMELDGGLSFRTAASAARYVRRVQTERPPRLSRAALETLAVIAYRQPATKPQVEEVRGVDSGAALKALLDKHLIRVIGKADDIGRPLLYGTTKTFLEYFQLGSLSELPTLKELNELENGPSEPVPVEEGQTLQAAVVMDLFNPDRPGLVSEETEKESAEALDALERALTSAKDVAKRASTVVWGVTVDDDDPKPIAAGVDEGTEPAPTPDAAGGTHGTNGQAAAAPEEPTEDKPQG